MSFVKPINYSLNMIHTAGGGGSSSAGGSALKKQIFTANADQQVFTVTDFVMTDSFWVIVDGANQEQATRSGQDIDVQTPLFVGSQVIVRCL